MKKLTFLLLITLSFTFTSMAQVLSYQDLAMGKAKGTFESYAAKDGHVYKVGDTLIINSPSGVNGLFVNIESMNIMGRRYLVGAQSANTTAVLKKIRVGGSKRAGWKAAFQTQGFSSVDNYFFFIEDAVASGEISIKGRISSDEALAELKKAKEKLDLELITEEEYNALKTKYASFIK